MLQINAADRDTPLLSIPDVLELPGQVRQAARAVALCLERVAPRVALDALTWSSSRPNAVDRRLLARELVHCEPLGIARDHRRQPA